MILELGFENIPIEYLNFIKETDGAKLFYDKTYGQAGMYLYETDIIYKKNLEWHNSYMKQDLLPTDLIIGEFFGDNDLVVLRCDNMHIPLQMITRSTLHVTTYSTLI